jgi:dynein heavy chain, axonemal
VKFALSEKTTLSDLLSLSLHKYEDEVRNIVDKSVKEMSMEKVLNGINEAWAEMHFDNDIHPRTGITMLKASDELIETLEENQVISVQHVLKLED